MNNHATRYWYLGLAMALWVTTSCTKTTRETKFAPSSPQFNMVIALKSSEFKDDIKDKLVERYKNNATMKIVPINDLKEIETKDYDVVLIIDARMGWSMFNSTTKGFIRKTIEKDKIVLFITTPNPNRPFIYKGVDAITSASRTETPDTIVDQISMEIDKIITQSR